MGTEVLRPQDCLIRPALAAFHHHRRPHPKPLRRPLPEPAKRRREPSPRPAKPAAGPRLVMGCVTILKRGESPQPPPPPSPPVEAKVETGRIGPDPAAIRKQIRIRLAPAAEGREEEEGPASYAGTAFSMSPSPRKLPLPRFSRRIPEVAVDDSATKDLRRLLRMD